MSPLADCPVSDSTNVGTSKWVKWFLSAKEGTTMARSASKYGWTGGRDWTTGARAEQARAQQACPTSLKVFVYQRNALKTRCCKESALVEAHILFLPSLANILKGTPRNLIRTADINLPNYAATPLKTLISPGKSASAAPKDLAGQLKSILVNAPTAVAAAAPAAPVWLPVQPADCLAAAASRDVLLLHIAGSLSANVVEKDQVWCIELFAVLTIRQPALLSLS